MCKEKSIFLFASVHWRTPFCAGSLRVTDTVTGQALRYGLRSSHISHLKKGVLVEGVRAGRLRPVIGEVVDFTELPTAMTRMRDRKTTGRVIVTVG